MQAMLKIKKEEFLEIFQGEIAYYGKRWAGITESEREENQLKILNWYYKEVQHVTAEQLQRALDAHRRESTVFPKINQLLAKLPKPDTYTGNDKNVVKISEAQKIKNQQKMREFREKMRF